MTNTIRYATNRRTDKKNLIPIAPELRKQFRRGIPLGIDPTATFTLDRPANWYTVRRVLQSVGFTFNAEASEMSGHDHWHGYFMDSPHKDNRIQLEIGLVVAHGTGYANATVDIVTVKGARAYSYITNLNRAMRVVDLLDWLLMTLGNQMQTAIPVWREDALAKLRFTAEY